MIKRVGLLIVVAIMAVSLMANTAVPVFAAPPLPEGCTKERGTIVCEQEEEGKNPKFEQETTTSKKGSFQSSHEPVVEERCTQDKQGVEVERKNCPEGQFQ